jgi:hypothetical protein
MKGFIFLILWLSSSAFALDALVIVLEAPYFREPDIESMVVQYARKGDVIKIHPSVANTDKFNHLAPEQRKLSKIRKKLRQSPEWNEDPMFKGDEDDNFSVQDDFIAVLDRQGKRAYVRKDHIYVYFNDKREFTQAPYRHDETDYRLEEPLPKKYPFPSVKGYRGQFLLGVVQPYNESYPYLRATKTKGYASPIDVSVSIMKEAGEKKVDRFYFGATANLRSYKNNFNFIGGGSSTEENYRLGVGPYISYDAYKGVKNRVNLYSSVNVYALNFTTINQTTASGVADSRSYQAFSVSPRIGLQYHRKSILPEIDFVMGTGLEMETPSTFYAKGGAEVEGIWNNPGNDSFKTRFVWNIGAFMGVQSAY